MIPVINSYCVKEHYTLYIDPKIHFQKKKYTCATYRQTYKYVRNF